MQRERYAGLLASIPLFAGCTRQELRHLARLTDQVDVEPGRVLIRQGAAGHEFFVIASGKVEVSRGDRVVATLGPGDYVGELALLDPAPRTATVTAVEPTTAIVLGTRDFWDAISTLPGFDKKLLASMARRLRAAESPAY